MKLDLVQIPPVLSFLCLILLLLIPELAMCLPRKTMTVEDYPVPDKSQDLGSVPPSASPSSDPAFDHASTKSLPGSFPDLTKGGLHGNVLTLSRPSKSDPVLNPPASFNLHLKKICAATDHPQICLSAISPFFSHHRRVDAAEVLKMAIRACKRQIKATISLATEQLARKEVDADVVKTCKDEYGDALDSLEEAMDAFRRRDVGTVRTMLGAVIADVSSCSDELSGKGSILVAHDRLISNMVSNCLVIASSVNS